MRATGIVRRVDELGRIVIPKEIRKLTAIGEDDPLEIFYDHEGIILKKYRPTELVRNIIADLKTAVREEDCISNRSVLLDKIRELEALLNTKETSNDQS